MASKPTSNNQRTSALKPRTLSFEVLEDRSVPAALAGYDVQPTAYPADIATAHAAPMHVMIASATTTQGTALGKLTANHNQTLVRDRRSGKSRRG